MEGDSFRSALERKLRVLREHRGAFKDTFEDEERRLSLAILHDAVRKRVFGYQPWNGNLIQLLDPFDFYRMVPEELEHGAHVSICDIERPMDPQEKRRLEAKREKELAEMAERERFHREEQARLEKEQMEYDRLMTRKRVVRKSFMSKLRKHQEAFHEFFAKHSKAQKAISNQVVQHISAAERRKKAIEEKESRLRMKALKENDMEAYQKLLQEHKSGRLSQLLEKSSDYLKQLGDKMTLETDPSKDMADLDGSNEGTKTTLSHQIEEVITEQPEMLQFGTLKDYQLQGLQWLVSLYNNNLNGILADEMGLGKTIQTIALLCYVMEKKGDHGPFLIVVPLSTISNWEFEFQRWAPGVVALSYNGKPGFRNELYEQFIQPQKFNVLITTYEYIIRKQDRKRLEKIEWHYIIVDEGHRMKNQQSKFSHTLSKKYTSKHRLILTGTPLQNKLSELWSLLNFLLPNIFNSSENFEAWFNKPFESAGASDTVDLLEEEKMLIINRLHQVLRPFLLRRLKTDVAKFMPEKTEVVLKCKMSAWQDVEYERIRNRCMVQHNSETGKMSSKSLNNIVMQLKKICNHPYLFFDNAQLNALVPSDQIVRCSGKFEILDRMIPKFIQSGHKMLIFFQMTKVIDIMEDYLMWRRWKYLRLDGGTKQVDRGNLLQSFNSDDSCFIFLLSTRAGGLGLNLQVADTVIIFDSDWNPQMDLQAQDRAHRIGQKNEVRVFRLISISPLEESILQRAQEKLGIDNMVIQAGRFNKHSTDVERKEILEKVVRCGFDIVDKLEAPTPSQLNEILARGDDEYEMFQNIDRDIERRRFEIWKALGNREKLPPRLMQYDELPEYLKASIVELQEKEKSFQNDIDGVGRRRRRRVSYATDNNEDFSDDYFQSMDDEAAEPSFDGSVDEGTFSDQLESIVRDWMQIYQGVHGISTLPDPEEYPEYYAVVDDPICLESIRDEIVADEFTSVRGFGRRVKSLIASLKQWQDFRSSAGSGLVKGLDASIAALKEDWRIKAKSIDGEESESLGTKRSQSDDNFDEDRMVKKDRKQ